MEISRLHNKTDDWYYGLPKEEQAKYWAWYVIHINQDAFKPEEPPEELKHKALAMQLRASMEDEEDQKKKPRRSVRTRNE